MIIRKAELETVCGYTSKLPQNRLPEIAFAGRSNVGKSSLLNNLTRRRALAKVSATPGKTRLINVFLINDAFHLIDLPGYGYAQVDKGEKRRWGEMMEGYFSKSYSLKLTLHLVDIRHPPTKDDLTMNTFLRSSGLNFYVIATKLDKISRAQRLPCLTVLYRTLSVQPWQVLPYSSETGEGREKLLELINKAVMPAEKDTTV
jgi:GTP-binding protein